MAAGQLVDLRVVSQLVPRSSCSGFPVVGMNGSAVSSSRPVFSGAAGDGEVDRVIGCGAFGVVW